MNGNADNEKPETPAFDPRFQTENIAFDHEKLIPCGKCTRSNPPNRLRCIYCGSELEVADAASIRPTLRPLEPWERGVNIIVESGEDENVEIANVAGLLSMDTDDLSMILKACEPLPIARVENAKEAAILRNGLERFGLKCSLVKDEDLADDKPPIRLSGMEIGERSLALKNFNTGSATQVAAADVVLIVPGVITNSRIDSLAKRGFRSEAKLIDESATATDEAILDIYVSQDPIGFRVRLSGFDFSCLGQSKGFIATKNIQRLIAVLREHSPDAKFVDGYSAARQMLARVWDVESRKESSGVKHSGFGKAELGVVDSTNNLNQFTKYSRLQWHLL